MASSTAHQWARSRVLRIPLPHSVLNDRDYEEEEEEDADSEGGEGEDHGEDGEDGKKKRRKEPMKLR